MIEPIGNSNYYFPYPTTLDCEIFSDPEPDYLLRKHLITLTIIESEMDKLRQKVADLTLDLETELATLRILVHIRVTF